MRLIPLVGRNYDSLRPRIHQCVPLVLQCLRYDGGGPFAIVGLVGLALIVGKAAVLYGPWTLQYWDYKWAFGLYALSAVLDLVTFSIFALIIDVLIVAYIASKADPLRQSLGRFFVSD